MFETLFGSELPLAARFFIAFLVVLALIGVTAWLVRRFGANRLGASARGRQPRLAVIDAATVDGRRRLVLIRRDNIEHLLMIGGPTDLVVEPNIVRAVGSREVAREPARLAATIETAPRAPADNGWPLQPVSEPTPVAAPRPYRSPATEEPWHAPEPGARPRPADSLTGLAAELSTRLNPSDMAPPPPPRSEPAPRVSATAATAARTRRTGAERSQLWRKWRSSSKPRCAVRPMPARRSPIRWPRKPGPPMCRRARRPAIINCGSTRDFEPKFDAKPEPRLDLPMPTPGKNLYENLEEEMASLLGRPPGKT